MYTCNTLHLLAYLDLEFARGMTSYYEKCLVSRVAHTFVPQPDVTQNCVDGRLVISVALRELCVVVFRYKVAFEVPFEANAALLTCAHPKPPDNVSEHLLGTEIPQRCIKSYVVMIVDKIKHVNTFRIRLLCIAPKYCSRCTHIKLRSYKMAGDNNTLAYL